VQSAWYDVTAWPYLGILEFRDKKTKITNSVRPLCKLPRRFFAKSVVILQFIYVADDNAKH